MDPQGDASMQIRALEALIRKASENGMGRLAESLQMPVCLAEWKWHVDTVSHTVYLCSMSVFFPLESCLVEIYCTYP